MIKIKYSPYSLVFVLFICFQVAIGNKAQSFEQVLEDNIEQSFSNIPLDEVKSGILFFRSAQGYQVALAQESDYQVKVTGMLGRTTLKQTFKNLTDQWVEAVYIYPLATGSAIDRMKMIVGERIVLGRIAEKKVANKIYQKAKKDGKKASLVSQQRPNLFINKVANIAPQQEISVEISFLQAIEYNQGVFSLRLPLTITPRFTPRKLNSLVTNNASQSTPLVTPIQVSSAPWQQAKIDISLPGQGYVNIKSYYHSIKQSADKNRVQIQLNNKSIPMDRDFKLTWQLSNSGQQQVKLFTESDNSYHYGLLMVLPREIPSKSSIAKEMIYVIDTSGSMAGVAIKQAKAALSYAIRQLQDKDRFNVIAFNNKAHQLFSHALEANENNKYAALDWVDELNADGGTNIHSALEQALGIYNHPNWHRQVVFITDGAVSNEAELFNDIEKNLLGTRLHTVGIGSAPNSYFMKRAAEVGRGSYRYIGDIREVEHQISTFFQQISQPQLIDIEAQWLMGGVEMYPERLPDLYQDQPLLISFRWPRQELSNESGIILTGNKGLKYWREKIKLNNINRQSSAEQENNSSSIAVWWARQKLAELSDKKRRSDVESRAVIDKEILNLALQYQLLSPLTSFIAVEQELSRSKTDKLSTKSMINAMPKGSQQPSKSLIHFAQTATAAPYYLLQALFWLVLSVIAWCVYFFAYHKRFYG